MKGRHVITVHNMSSPPHTTYGLTRNTPLRHCDAMENSERMTTPVPPATRASGIMCGVAAALSLFQSDSPEAAAPPAPAAGGIARRDTARLYPGVVGDERPTNEALSAMSRRDSCMETKMYSSELSESPSRIGVCSKTSATIQSATRCERPSGEMHARGCAELSE